MSSSKSRRPGSSAKSSNEKASNEKAKYVMKDELSEHE
jgi:hypothetical protein